MTVRRSIRRDLALPATVAIVGVVYVLAVLVRRAASNRGVPSFDIYAAQYPNVLYALRGLLHGHGLLWNSLQNCGQPFLPSTLLGPFYPPHVIFLGLSVDSAFIVIAGLHLIIAGLGTYWLCRELGIAAAGAVTGACAFMLSGVAVQLVTWVPTAILGAYVWIPTAMLLCERVLKAPTLAPALTLGLVLTASLLAAFPQVLLFTYQLIALRVMWEIGTTRVERPARTLGLFLVAMVMPALLGAVQLLPMTDFAQASLRGRGLTPTEIKPLGALTWQLFRAGLRTRIGSYGTLLTPVTLGLIGAAIAAASRRRSMWFYFFAGALFCILAFENPVFQLYEHLPMGQMFRRPERFLWMTGFAASVVVAFGTDAMTRCDDGAAGRARQLGGFCSGVVLFACLTAVPLRTIDWIALFVVLGTWVVAAAAPRAELGVRLAVPFMVIVYVGMLGVQPLLGFRRDGSLLYRNAPAFGFVTRKMTLQERMYTCGRHPDYGLMPKSAQVFGLRSATDYEPQTSRRYAELEVMLLQNATLDSLNQYLFRSNVPQNRNILDLMAVRYIVVDRTVAAPLNRLGGPPLIPIWEQENTQVLENTQALPRASFVPRAEVVADPIARLKRLASPHHDPRRLALLDEVPADSFLGSNDASEGEVEIVSDTSEELVVRVRATQAGFVSVSDQYYSGWYASRDGESVPILRANHAFRLVRVPPGNSTIVFTYQPRSVTIGAALTAITALVLSVVALSRMARTNGRFDMTPSS